MSAPPDPRPPKPSKEMSKAERRAHQEAQRAAKAAAKAAGSSALSNKSNATLAGLSSSSSSAPSSISQSAAGPAQNQHQHQNQPRPGPTPQQLPPGMHSVSLFQHLERRILSTSSPQVHPAILQLGTLFEGFKIVGGNARCTAMLKGLQAVIASYTAPPGTTLSRQLVTHLSPQIAHLEACRPKSISMGNAIRWLKLEVANLDPEMGEQEAKDHLCQRIDHFIRDRIVVADEVITQHAISKIRPHDRIITFARSSIVEKVLLRAARTGIAFSVILVDSRPMLEAKALLRVLSAQGIPCTYALLTSLPSLLPTASLALLGAHALLSNGALYSRVGTASVAMLARGAGVPVVVCCETYKFVDRVMLDSIVVNELAPSASLLPTLPPPNSTPRLQSSASLHPLRAPAQPHLRYENFLYDVTPPAFIVGVATEVGLIPPAAVPTVMFRGGTQG